MRENNDPCIGPGGAPTRASTLPSDAAERKRHPVASGVLDYFPDALAAVARVSWQGNEQHNPGQPLHWARGKSTDEADTMMRHFLQRGTIDTDGQRHSAKMVWRALALLQKEIEGERANELSVKEHLYNFKKQASAVYEPPAHTIQGADVVKVMDDHHENFMPAKKMGEPQSIRSWHDHGPVSYISPNPDN